MAPPVRPPAGVRAGRWAGALTGTLAGAMLALAAGATELNQASQAELESLPGIGPQLSERLLAERRRQPFADWADLRARVAGIGPATAARLSAAGLTVNGQPLPQPAR